MLPLPYLYKAERETINVMNKNEKFVITINRELGSGGHTVGRLLAEKLGVPYYDKAVQKPLEEKFNMSLDEIEHLKGTNRSWWQEIKRVLILGEDAANSPDFYDEENKKLVTSEAVLKAEKEILHSIAIEQSCVIAGRSAFFVLNGYPNSMNVLIQAPMEFRLNRIMTKRGISEKEARKIIEEVDATREEYLKNNANTSRYDTRNYDLVINMAGKTEEDAVRVILAYIG